MDNTQLPNNLRSFIWYFLKPYKFAVLIYIICAIVTGFWGPINSYLLKIIINSLSVARSSNVVHLVFWPAVFFIVNLQVHELGWRGTSYIIYKFQPIIKNKIIQETFNYIHQQAHQFFQDNFAGKISNQISILADNIERILSERLRHLIRGLVLLLIGFISMFLVNPRFFYVLAIWLIIFVFFGIFLSRRLIELSEEHANADSIIAGQLVDSIANASNVRFFSKRNYELSYLEGGLNLSKKAFQAMEIFTLKLDFFRGISLVAMLGFMMFFLIQLRMREIVSIGDFALILSLALEIAWITWWSLDQLNELNKEVGKCNQSIVSLFTPLEIKDKPDAKLLVVSKGQIVFSKVKFHYKGMEPLFQDKSVTIEAGQKIGLVGYSGSGKTTFVNLILRLYDITDGHIFIDNQDISEVTQESLRSHIAMIPQDPSLFHRTLLENIRYGRIHATNEEVIVAAKQAHAHEFISKQPLGYSTLVGERGVKLSGGQRQRIAIARAILKDAPILILDEATSQLDSLTESDIQESLWQLMQNRTTIVIAHRLSTLLHMDRILVFDQGSIVQDGKHADLLSQDGLYKTLWNAQVCGFLPDKKGSSTDIN